MTDKELKRLTRSELLEIILMLKEKERVLAEENQVLSEKLEKISEQILAKKSALAADNALGNAFAEMNKAYSMFKKKAVKYHVLLEEAGMNAVGKKQNSNEV